MHLVVVDTNVIIAALRSRQGASFAVLSELGKSWKPVISVPLILEYEAVAKRENASLKIPEEAIEAVLRAFCFYGQQPAIHFRLRPALPDPRDDFILELAVAGRADRIVTYNLRDFRGAERFGVHAETPRELLRRIKGEAR